VRHVLEVGCNIGANLRWIRTPDSERVVYGVDISPKALTELRKVMPDVHGVWSQARDLPFPSDSFDLVFTAGVLIHQPPELLARVMGEIVRCSRRFVLCCEYYSPELTEIPYRGQTGALFKRDFGGLYQDLFPSLVLRQQGFLSAADGWDDVTYWMFEKRNENTRVVKQGAGTGS